MDMILFCRGRVSLRNGISLAGLAGKREPLCFQYHEQPSRNGKVSLLKCQGEPVKKLLFNGQRGHSGGSGVAVVWQYLLWDSETEHNYRSWCLHYSHETDKYIFPFCSLRVPSHFSNTRYKRGRTPFNKKGGGESVMLITLNIERRDSAFSKKLGNQFLCLTEKGLCYLKIEKNIFLLDLLKMFIVLKVCGVLMELLLGSWYQLEDTGS